MVRPRQIHFLETEETSCPIVTSDAQGPQLPASPRDQDGEMIINATPSGEVQMRVTREIHNPDESGNEEQRTDVVRPRHRLGDRDISTKNGEVEKLRQDLARHRDAEQTILGLLKDHEKRERFSHGRGDSSIEEYPGLQFSDSERRRLQQDDDLPGSNRPVLRPGTSSFPWTVSYSGGGDRTINDDTRETDVNHCGPDEGYGTSVQMNRETIFDTNLNTGLNPRRNRLTEPINGYSTIGPNYSNVNLVNMMNENDIKPKRPYDGTSSWQDHLVQFEMISTKNKWDKATKAYELATSLKGVARGVVTDLEPEMRLNYRHLVSELTSRFEPANQSNLFKTQMNSLYRRPGQTLPELAQDIRRITRLAYPTAPIDIRDQLAKDCFIRVVNDSKLQLSIFQREPKTISDCVRFGLEYESFTVDQRRLNPKPNVRMQYEVDPDDDFLGQVSKMSYQLDKLTKNNNQDDKNNLTCFYSGIKGHLRRACRKYANDKQNNTLRYYTPQTKQGSSKSHQYTQGTQTENMGCFNKQENY